MPNPGKPHVLPSLPSARIDAAGASMAVLCACAPAARFFCSALCEFAVLSGKVFRRARSSPCPPVHQVSAKLKIETRPRFCFYRNSERKTDIRNLTPGQVNPVQNRPNSPKTGQNVCDYGPKTGPLAAFALDPVNPAQNEPDGSFFFAKYMGFWAQNGPFGRFRAGFSLVLNVFSRDSVQNSLEIWFLRISSVSCSETRTFY